jgi:hypothetical protein
MPEKIANDIELLVIVTALYGNEDDVKAAERVEVWLATQRKS